MAISLAYVVATLTAGVLAYAGALLIRSRADRLGLVDIPNSRSSHSIPVPKGGGAGIVAGVLGGSLVLALRGDLQPALAAALLFPFLAVAVAGFIDDRVELNNKSRLLVQIVGALIWVMYIKYVGLRLPIQDSYIIGVPLAVIMIVGAANVTNFMDGIDGLAASQVAFMSLGAVLLTALLAEPAPITQVLALVGVSSLVFLCLNWPPASIFMGDVGSASLGFLLGAIALGVAQPGGLSIGVWAILGGVFIADTSVTLLTRIATNQAWSRPHRSHAYQKLARRWGSHRPVTRAVLLLNLAWLLPLATLAMLWPEAELILVGVAYAPLVAICLVMRSGVAS